ncbi:MAG: oxygen-independent coproporphyrinogen III oxidase [Acidobacteria bacterium 13_1_20CM_3_53_8]|nr:MAG: oxygen-independent coproporphyrinogen III oxidase [Acidobacteria bacterium 13_1_20CM_3_53_8]
MQATISAASELLKKYDVPGPRYTSYPTIVYWDDNPTVEDWTASVAQALDETERVAGGAGLYIHIPFCRSLCTYCGCNTRITRHTEASKPYVETVLKEWSLYRRKLERQHPIPLTEIHLGGGTPTFLPPDELAQLIEGILSHALLTPDAEFSIEADPRTTTKEQLLMLARLGFRRLSLGIQDFDARVQDIVNRIQTEEQVRAVTMEARAAGFTSINYDLIYGLPFQTLKSVEQTIEAVRRLRPDRIAFYAYAHVPWIKPGQRRFTEMDLPSGEEKRALYELGRALLEEAGYREIGMDHFALETDSLWRASAEGTLHRNFMGYITRQSAPLIGLGVSSISDSWSVFTQNEKKLEDYVARIKRDELPIFRGHQLTKEDRILRRHILNLMTRFETSWESRELYVPFLETVNERLAEMRRDGLVKLSDKRCEVTADGRPFLRNVCMAFDARLVRKVPATQIFSRTI